MNKKIGVYVHVPFCAGKCAYCDFYSVVDRENLMPEYCKAVVRHIKEYSEQLSEYYVDTVYFGGGTPTVLGAAGILEIFEALKKYCRVLVDSEVTIEANPESMDLNELAKLRKAGVNRISIGMQSANDIMLKALGRLHDFARVEQAVIDARRAGFDNLSLDLIYGLPKQSKEDWANSLSKAIGLKPEHISCYGLKLEKGTPMYSLKDSDYIPDGDTQADMYLYMVNVLRSFGYHQYEISNFSKKGFESKHNLKYWRCREYVGFGPAAHSYVGSMRYSNVSDVKKYIECISKGESVVDHYDEVSDFERASEYIMLAMRTSIGISKKEYDKLNALGMVPLEELLTKFREYEWATYSKGRWRFTPKGFLVSNQLIGMMLDVQQEQRLINFNKQSGNVEAKGNNADREKNETVPVFHGI